MLARRQFWELKFASLVRGGRKIQIGHLDLDVRKRFAVRLGHHAAFEQSRPVQTHADGSDFPALQPPIQILRQIARRLHGKRGLSLGKARNFKSAGGIGLRGQRRSQQKYCRLRDGSKRQCINHRPGQLAGSRQFQLHRLRRFRRESFFEGFGFKTLGRDFHPHRPAGHIRDLEFPVFIRLCRQPPLRKGNQRRGKGRPMELIEHPPPQFRRPAQRDLQRPLAGLGQIGLPLLVEKSRRGDLKRGGFRAKIFEMKLAVGIGSGLRFGSRQTNRGPGDGFPSRKGDDLTFERN